MNWGFHSRTILSGKVSGISYMEESDNAVVDAIKLIQLTYSNFSIAKIVVKK